MLKLFPSLMTLALASVVSLSCSSSQFPDDAPRSLEVGAGFKYDSIKPVLPKNLDGPSMLVFYKVGPGGYKHVDSIPAGNTMFREIAREKEMGFLATANGAVFSEEIMEQFELVVFNNAAGDMLSKEQEAVFQKWLENGGGWIGVHGAGDSSHEDWDWYANELIGPKFIGHPMEPQFQTASVDILDTSHPVMRNIPARFEHEEEWYSFDSTAQSHGAKALAGVDEKTYDPTILERNGEKIDLYMGTPSSQHPVMWSRCMGEGRTFYSALGHQSKAFEVDIHQQIMKNAVDWVMKKTDQEGAGCE